MELFLIGATLALSINLELGVVNVTVVRTAIERGALPAFLIGLGSCIGDVVWACAGALGSPTLIIWTATVGGSVVAAHASSAAGFAPFIAGFATAGVVHSAVLSGIVGATRRLAGARVIRAVGLISALMFAGFAVGIFVDGFRRLALPLLAS